MEGLEEFHDPEKIGARLAYHRTAIAEEQKAREICDAVLTGPSRWWGNALRGVEGGRTAGMVTILIERSDAAFDHRSPSDALVLSDLALEVASELKTAGYPYDQLAKLRGGAMRTHAYVLSHLGRLMEAERIADMAGVILRESPIPLIELARLDLVRSNITRNMGKFDKAIAYARQAGKTYRDFGNRRSWMVAIDFEGAAYYSAQNYKSALDLWRSTEEYVAILTPEHQADRLHNIGLCASALGDFDEAARSFAGALAEFERLGMVVNRVKCHHSLGVALHEAGRHADAITVLEKVQEELDALGMENDAALAALTRVEALFAAGRPNEVPAICRMLIERFTRAGNSAAAMTALSYLRETVATGHATPQSVRQIRDFIRDSTLHFAASTPYAQPLADSTKRLDG